MRLVPQAFADCHQQLRDTTQCRPVSFAGLPGKRAPSRSFLCGGSTRTLCVRPARRESPSEALFCRPASIGHLRRERRLPRRTTRGITRINKQRFHMVVIPEAERHAARKRETPRLLQPRIKVFPEPCFRGPVFPRYAVAKKILIFLCDKAAEIIRRQLIVRAVVVRNQLAQVIPQELLIAQNGTVFLTVVFVREFGGLVQVGFLVLSNDLEHKVHAPFLVPGSIASKS